MKIYTKTGDTGKTSLGSTARVSKSHLRIECCGSFDELNAAIALFVDQAEFFSVKNEGVRWLSERCQHVQRDLFSLGAELSLATKDSVFSQGKALGLLEQQIDAMTSKLPPLKNFILPGGNILNSQLHLARTICRRAERRMISLFEAEGWQDGPLAYVNRLSDWLFTGARFVSFNLKAKEMIWQPTIDGN